MALRIICIQNEQQHLRLLFCSNKWKSLHMCLWVKIRLATWRRIFLTLLLPRSPDLDVSAIFRRGQSQQVSSTIQHTSWQVKINGICLPASPFSFPLAAGCSPSPEPPASGIVSKICTPPVYKSLKPPQWGEEKKFSFLAILEPRLCVQGAPWQRPLEWFCSSICSICSCSSDRTPSQEGCSSLATLPV